MGLREKMDFMDLIISSLREHERSLDELVRRLKAASKHSASKPK